MSAAIAESTRLKVQNMKDINAVNKYKYNSLQSAEKVTQYKYACHQLISGLTYKRMTRVFLANKFYQFFSIKRF